jgi:lactoylglutathione lyase
MTRIELFVSDLARSRAWYEALGFRVAREYGDWLMLALGDNVLDLQGDGHAVAGPHYFTPEIQRWPRGTGVEISIEVEEIDRFYERALGLGVDVVKPMQDRPWKARDFRVADPDGYFLRFTTPLRTEVIPPA